MSDSAEQINDRICRVSEYGDLIERLNDSGKWWMIGKGQAKPGEKLWGCLIQEPRINGAELARSEGNDLLTTVWRALDTVENPPTR